MKPSVLLLALFTLVSSCDSSRQTADDAPMDLMTTANTLAQNAIIIDTHVDVPYRLEEAWDDVSDATDRGDFDYPRAVAGGLNAPFMSIYTPASMEPSGESKAKAEKLIDMVYGIAEAAPEKFAVALSPADIVDQFSKGLISLPLGMENGSPIEGDLDNLQHFFDRGIRYITLAHSKSNHISDSSYDENKRWKGLSDFGKEVVAEMNRLGMMIDISHVSDSAFDQVIELSQAPVIASHSSARHFTPDFERNMSDEMIQKLAANGGVIMINFGSTFISAKSREYSKKRSDAYKAYLVEDEHEDSDPLNEKFRKNYDAENGGFPFADIGDVLDHFDHVVSLVGIDYVGIGSDYDGVGDSLPTGLKDVSSYPNLVHGFLQRGYSEKDITKILGGNLLRVWRAVEDAAD